MPQNKRHVLIPPILLTSLALLFWGVTTGSVIVAMLLAVLLDCRRWIPVQWDFEEGAQVKAFQLSLLLVTVGVAINWIDESEVAGGLDVMRWMPVMFLPVEFVQRYGRSNTVNLNSFFFFSRRRMELDRNEGREVHPIQINTGYPYILGVIIAASTTEALEWYFWGAMSVLIFTVVLSVSYERGVRARGLWLVIPAVLVLGWGIQWTMTTTYLWVKENIKGLYDSRGRTTFLEDYTSHLGELGDVRLNPRIEWRVWSDSNPGYLRLASHNNYNQGRWTYDYITEGYDTFEDSYRNHFRAKLETKRGEVTYFDPSDKKVVESGKSSDAMELRGTIADRQSTSVVPSAPGYYAVSKILGEGTYAEVNSMGSFRFSNRDMVISYMLDAAPDRTVLDKQPLGEVDLRIPKAEKQVIVELVDQLGLRSIEDPLAVVATLERYFADEFEYSTDFDPGEVDYERSKLEWFLTELKCGHCEYYATAAVLVLRELGIPARYATGYSVSERGSDCWNVRGTDAHAWTRAYIGGNWINVDLTPPDRRGSAAYGGVSAVDWLREKINMMREDFFIWRQDPMNRTSLLVKVSVVAGLLVIWILYRLWVNRSKRELPMWDFASWNGDVIRTPLHQLERFIQKKVGPRNGGEPYALWVGRLAEREGVDKELVDQVVRSHQEMRYDPESTVKARELQVLVKKLKRQTRKV